MSLLISSLSRNFLLVSQIRGLSMKGCSMCPGLLQEFQLCLEVEFLECSSFEHKLRQISSQMEQILTSPSALTQWNKNLGF